jgi:hypothetical protein
VLIDARGQAALGSDGNDFGLCIERGEEIDRTDGVLWVWIVPRENSSLSIGLGEFDGGVICVVKACGQGGIGPFHEHMNSVARLIDRDAAEGCGRSGAVEVVDDGDGSTMIEGNGFDCEHGLTEIRVGFCVVGCGRGQGSAVPWSEVDELAGKACGTSG